MAGFTSPYNPVPGVTPVTPPSQASPSSSPTMPHKFVATDGWYVFGLIVFGIAVSSTRLGPVVLGIETVALIFQLTLLLQGK